MDAAILLGSFIVLILLRVPVAYSLGVSALIGAWWIDIPLHAVMIQIAGGVNKFSLLAIPFFVLAGAIMAEGGMARRLVAFAGVLIGFGNIIRLAGDGDFVSWNESMAEFGYYTVVGLILLPLVRLFADKVLLPGASLSDELVKTKPNLGAGVLEAVSYLAASMLIGLTL